MKNFSSARLFPRPHRHFGNVFWLTGALFLWPALHPAQAQTVEAGSLVVTTLSDASTNTDGLTSLREAITFANRTTSTADEIISFNVSGTITLGSALPAVADAATTGSLIIRNNQPNAVIISGNNASRILSVAAGGDLTLNSLTLSNGNVGANGGAITNAGTLRVRRSTFSNNTAGGAGGAIRNTGTLSVSNSTFSGNSASDGGAIDSNATLIISHSTITSNTATTTGGGVRTTAGTFSLTSSLITGNSAPSSPNVSSTSITSVNSSIGGDSQLGPLTDNGGTTFTHLPLSGSSAINTGSEGENIDQRGVTRPQGASFDRGAVEVGSSNSPDANNDRATTNEDTAVTIAVLDNDVDTDTPKANLRIKAGSLTNVVGGTATINSGRLSVTFTPSANTNGSSGFGFSYVTTDGAGNDSAPATVSINVTPVNDAPTLDTITNVIVDEDAGAQTVNLSGISAGGDETQTLTITATSDNTAVVPNPTVTYTSPNATGTLSFAPVADANGTATITVMVTDNGGTENGGVNNTTRTFTVTVNAVNDAPTLDPITDVTVDEDAEAQTVDLSGISAGGGETQALTITATSDNTSVVPDPSVTYTNSDTTGTLSFKPAADANGTATITVTVTDNGSNTQPNVNTFVQTFTVTVNSINDSPTALTLSAQSVDENSAIGTVIGTFSTTDIDTDGAFTYSFVDGEGATNNDLFTIDENTLKTNTSLDFETQTSYSIRVQTDDGQGGTFQETFIITVNDVNEAVVAQDDETLSGSVGQDFNEQIEASDVDANTTLSFSHD
jgi:predicted outer membrane repeat protein